MAQARAIKKVAVIGAGVMGQGIAAHMINAGLDCFLLDQVAESENKNEVSALGLARIAKSKPSLIYNNNLTKNIKIGNTSENLDWLKECDLVIEAIIEKLEPKQELFRSIEPHLGLNTIVASNTSGLSLEKLLKGFSAGFCERFIVMHFFNPVRYLHLLELVPTPSTSLENIEKIKYFGENILGKGVVIGKDTPNFVANRIGVYAMMEALRCVESHKYEIEEVDAVFGAKLGRPRSAVFRTADIVGLDTFIHVAENCYENLPKDECREIFKTPEFLRKMVNQGWLGQKSGQGFYKKQEKIIYALDIKNLKYREKKRVKFDSISKLNNLSKLEDKYKKLVQDQDRAAKLFFELTAKTCIYAANRLYEIADTIYDIDNAMEWGFGWELGPFKTWDAIGVRDSLTKIEQLGLKVPAWVNNMIEGGRESFYNTGPNGISYVYCPKTSDQIKVPKSSKETSFIILKQEKQNIVHDTDAYSLVDSRNGALIVEFHTKMNAIDQDILAGINLAVDKCEAGEFEALVIANQGANFSVGANILLLYMAAMQNMWGDIEKIVRLFQETGQRLKYCSVPTVSAPFQMALGGGCELSMWCDSICAHAETYMGLVEVGVGLIPGGGGNIEMVNRALMGVPDTPTYVTENLLMGVLETVAMAKVSTSIEEAFGLKYCMPTDSYSMNRRFHIHDACTKAVAMARSGYRPMRKRSYRLPGANGYATFDMGLRAFLEGKFISEHDYKIAKKVAWVMTGGNTTSNQKVPEDMLLELEREAFLSLCGEKKTQERIAYMLENNKPLRN